MHIFLIASIHTGSWNYDPSRLRPTQRLVVAEEDKNYVNTSRTDVRYIHTSISA